jgi:chemotaxis protein MotB
MTAAALARAGATEAEARGATQRAGAAEQAQRDAEAAMREAVARAATAEQARQRAEDIARQAATVQAAAERARTEAERDASARIAAAERARTEADALRQEAANRAGRAEATAGEQTRLADSARAQVALLTRQIEALRARSRASSRPRMEEASGRDRDAQIALLGQRLNAALAARVEELQRYRSDFFGRLREVLGDRPEVRIVGDRFVFQSRGAVPPAQRGTLRGRAAADARPRRRVLNEIAPQIPGRRRLGAARGRPCRPHADPRHRALREQLGTGRRARHRGGAAADRGRAAGQPRRRGVLRRHPADRCGGRPGRARAQPAHRIAADGSLSAGLRRLGQCRPAP